jgi:hypothetical protein
MQTQNIPSRIHFQPPQFFLMMKKKKFNFINHFHLYTKTESDKSKSN